MGCNRIQDEEFRGQKLEVLYGEADAEVRTSVASHLRECGPCQEEMASFGRVRRNLKAWKIDEGRPSATAKVQGSMPAWLTAAAALLLGIGLGLALVGHLGLRKELASQEARAIERDREYKEEIAALRTELQERSRRFDGERLLASLDDRLHDRVMRSEERQSEQVQARLADWSGRIEARRRVDLARVAAGLSYLDGRQGRQLARTNQLMGYVLEAAAQEK
jgi:uncharacterized protein HemX